MLFSKVLTGIRRNQKPALVGAALAVLTAAGIVSAADASLSNMINNLRSEVILLKGQIVTLKEIAKLNPNPVKHLPDCGDANLKAVAHDYRCKNDDGYPFQFVQTSKLTRAWKLPDGSIWSEYLGDTSNFTGDRGDKFMGTRYESKAEALCASKGATLPSYSDFQLANEYGFRDVIPGIKDHTYWTSTSPGYDSIMQKELKYTNAGGKDSYEDEPSTLMFGVICIIKN